MQYTLVFTPDTNGTTHVTCPDLPEYNDVQTAGENQIKDACAAANDVLALVIGIYAENDRAIPLPTVSDATIVVAFEVSAENEAAILQHNAMIETSVSMESLMTFDPMPRADFIAAESEVDPQSSLPMKYALVLTPIENTKSLRISCPDLPEFNDEVFDRPGAEATALDAGNLGLSHVIRQCIEQGKMIPLPSTVSDLSFIVSTRNAQDILEHNAALAAAVENQQATPPFSNMAAHQAAVEKAENSLVLEHGPLVLGHADLYLATFVTEEAKAIYDAAEQVEIDRLTGISGAGEDQGEAEMKRDFAILGFKAQYVKDNRHMFSDIDPDVLEFDPSTFSDIDLSSIGDLVKPTEQPERVPMTFRDAASQQACHAALGAHIENFIKSTESITFENDEHETEVLHEERDKFLKQYMADHPDQFVPAPPVQPQIVPSHGTVIAAFNMDIGKLRVVVTSLKSDKIIAKFGLPDAILFMVSLEFTDRPGRSQPYAFIQRIPQGTNSDEIHTTVITALTQTYAHQAAQALRGLEVNWFHPKNTPLWHNYCAQLLLADGKLIKALHDAGAPLSIMGNIHAPDVIFVKLINTGGLIIVSHAAYQLELNNEENTAFIYNQYNIAPTVLNIKSPVSINVPTMTEVVEFTKAFVPAVNAKLAELCGSEDVKVISEKVNAGAEIPNAMADQLEGIIDSILAVLNGTNDKLYLKAVPTVLDAAFAQSSLASSEADISPSELKAAMAQVAKNGHIDTLDEATTKQFMDSAGLGDTPISEERLQEMAELADTDLTDDVDGDSVKATAGDNEANDETYALEGDSSLHPHVEGRNEPPGE